MNDLLLQTRRHFFQTSGLGIGGLALNALVAKDARPANPLAPKKQ